MVGLWGLSLQPTVYTELMEMAPADLPQCPVGPRATPLQGGVFRRMIPYLGSYFTAHFAN